MSRIIDLCNSLVSAINDAQIPQAPPAYLDFEAVKELEKFEPFIAISTTAPHSAKPTAIAPVTEHQFSLWLIIGEKFDGLAKDVMPKFLDRLEACWTAIAGVSGDGILFNGFSGDNLYDGEGMLQRGCFWSETQLNFTIAFDG